jgi:hypothetical protein
VSSKRNILILSCLSVLAGPAYSQVLQQEEPANRPVVETLITKLESPDFRDRQQATRLLLKLGPATLKPLKNRVYDGSLELAVRAMSIFESAYVGKDPTAVAVADEALEELARSKRQELAEHAQSVLVRNRATRTKIAVANLLRLGGEVDNYAPKQNVRVEDFQRDGPPLLILNKNWKGGVEGLKYVRRLKGAGFQIYLIDGAPLSEKAITELEASFDAPVIARRGTAMLGISGARATAGCLVLNVVEGKAAEKAGLRSGDIIQEMDGKPIEDFDKLVELLRNKQADEIIELKLLREPRDQPQSVRVKLGHWRRGNTSRSDSPSQERANPAAKPIGPPPKLKK